MGAMKKLIGCAIAFGLTAAFSLPACCVPGQPGTLDTTFAVVSPLGSGKFTAALGSDASFSTGIAIQPDGKILLSGTCRRGSDYDACVMRINADGTVDTSFGIAGRVPSAITNVQSFAIVLQPDGKFVLAGACVTSSATVFCAARFQPDGSVDTSFGAFGRVYTPVGLGSNRQRAAVLQRDGKIVIAGDCLGASNIDFCAVRYNAFGLPDESFGANGARVTPIGVGTDRAEAIVVQPDGKLVVAGYCSPLTNPTDSSLNDMCAVRYNSDGEIDTGFGNSGKVIAPADGIADRAKAITLQPDGKIVVVGSCNSRLCLSRYEVNGALDLSFGTNGKVLTNFGNVVDWGPALVVQPDGKVVISGICSVSSQNLFCVQRYNDSGSIDPTFGLSGSVTTAMGTEGNAYSLALQRDGKLIVAGWCTYNNVIQFCAARYDGGPFGYTSCSMDIDGDGRVLATTDSLIHTRIALGITGPAVIGGVNFAPNASRNTWPLIRDYLVTQCGMSLVQ